MKDIMKDIFELRFNNLKKLADKCGGRTELSNKLDISYNLLTQYIGEKHKNMGEEFAKKIEIKLNLPKEWMSRAQETGKDTNSAIEFEQYLTLPILSVQLSPITGDNNSTLESKMIINEFQRRELEEIGTKPENATWLRIEDESMLPSLKELPWVIVDKKKTEIDSGELYAFSRDDKIEVRRIFKEGRNYRISCDNPISKIKIPDQTMEYLENIKIMGRAVWQSGRI